MSTKTFEQAIGLAPPPSSLETVYRGATQFYVDLNETTRVLLKGDFTKPGGGAYTVSYEAPQFGKLNQFIVQTLNANGAVIGEQTVTGNFPRMEKIFHDVIYPAAAARNSIAWNHILPDDPPIPLDGTPTEVDLVNTDGTWTVLRGFGFTYAANGVPFGGTVTGIEQWDSTGTTFLQGTNLFSTELGGQINVPVKLVYAGLFDALAAQAFIAKLFAGATSLSRTGATGPADSVFQYYLEGAIFNGDDGKDDFSGGLGNDKLNGFGSGDVLRGLLGNDVLTGGDGNDVIVGGRGRDVMIGGPGDDRFDFDSVAEMGKTAATRDVIKDFDPAADRIDLSTIDANGALSGSPLFAWRGLAAFNDHPAQLHYFKDNKPGVVNDKTIVEGDINGDGVADFQIELIGLKTLDKGDFFL